MSDMNRDLDRYLRKRRDGQYAPTEPSWFDKMFQGAEEKESLTPTERAQVEKVEHDIERTEHQIEKVHEIEEELEAEQEEKVGLYHRLVRFFTQEKAPREHETVELHAQAQASAAGDANEDVKALARVMTVWLSRMPTRVRDEFKASDDYAQFTAILERRGIAKRR